LFSGGKDSTYATWVAEHQGWDVEALVSVLPTGVESLMFHFPNVRWTRIQAEAMGLPHRTIEAGKDELSSLLEGLDRIRDTLGIHLTGEGGEYETFVLDAPHFINRISIEKTHYEWDGQSGYLVIEQASLMHKSAN